MRQARRAALVALALAVFGYAPPSAAQAARRIAILDDSAPSVRAPYWAAFGERLRALGWSEGANVTIDAHYANGDRAKLDSLASAIVARKPDVFVVATTTVAVAARKATSEIPIVAVGVADPIRTGLVATLARPGGNVTGASFNQGEIVGKWLNFIREMAPGATRVAYVTDRANPGETLVFEELNKQARGIGLTVEPFDGVTSSGIERTFAAFAGKRFDALIVGTPSSVLAHRKQIVDAAADAKVPAIYARREYVEAGGLVSYGADFKPVFERGADYTDRILRGAKPADLPYEMASSFRLAVNPAAARRINLSIPPSIRVRADEVVQ